MFEHLKRLWRDGRLTPASWMTLWSVAGSRVREPTRSAASRSSTDVRDRLTAARDTLRHASTVAHDEAY